MIIFINSTIVFYRNDINNKDISLYIININRTPYNNNSK
jgi:hypothetical protein